jgi:glycogen phosphorylase
MIDIERTLRKIVSNFWFEWNSDVHLLFRSVDPYAWSLFRRNLYRFMKVQNENPLLFRRRVAELVINPDFLNRFTKVDLDFKSYMQPSETVITRDYPEMANQTVAYFSMEYGIDILQIYSGGLGILSGDHLRGASDIGLKMVAVGLFYLNGYYRQQIGMDGEMKVVYEALVPPRKPVKDFLPFELLKKAGTNDDLIVAVPMPGRTVKARIWKARVGRCELLLLDSNITENKIHDRNITRRLYASQKHYEEERRRRLEQELLLGLGGVQALIEGGYEPSVYHLNEGHVAFAAVEVIKNLMTKYQISFEDAHQRASQIVGFTTHTPVPEGNERFDERLVRDHLQPYLEQFLNHQGVETIFNCARNRENMFDMTKLSLLLSGVCRNGVSALHGEVCRRMWGYAWGNFDTEGRGVPITSITNSVHVPYWQKPLLRALIEEKGGLERVSEIPDEQIWSLHQEFKKKLIEKIRERVAEQLLHYKVDPQVIYDQSQLLLDENSFIIGFARRFAEYKRVTMLLEEEETLFRFLENAYRKYGKPVHIIYAGKPHPNNYSGRERIQYILNLAKRLEQRAKERDFKAQLIFIQGYDIDIARYLEAGVDIWLNNPIRPLEASGTSGMKAGMNGVLNVSISDGWVPEGVTHGKNGWLFGVGTYEATDQDRAELFNLLEREILPAYFDRAQPQDSFSKKWVGMMKNSIQTITQQFNTDRMLRDYIEKMYLPAVRNKTAQNLSAKA